MGDGYVKVSGMSGWYKNIQTGTVINTNEQEIQTARIRKHVSVKEKEDKNKMQDEVSTLKTEIEELKALIKGIAGK
tara:strand:+ start:23452 stop:23679 length:228 start_codon:yes stop_codon:yes gene_type:complete